jgi:hypothetical protein
MKKFIFVLVVAIFAIGSSFAFDMSIGIKGIVGADNSQVKGTALGGGLDINLDFAKGFGLQIESNIAPSTITSTKDGLTVANNMMVQIPVMAWYNARFNWFGFGLGTGISCILSENYPENSSNMKMGLSAGARMRFFVSENFAISLGATGNLDCFPTVIKTNTENGKNYKSEKSDFSRNAIYGSIGVEYFLPL